MVAVNIAAVAHLFNQQQHQRFIFHRQRHTTQAFAPRTRLIAMLFMVSRQRVEDFALPARGNFRIQQAVTCLNKSMLVNERTHTVAI